MKCPYCGVENTRVIDSRPADDGAAIRRRRQCDACNKRFTTYEKVDSIPLVVVKKDMNREPYDRAKIEAALNDLKETVKDESATKEQIDAKVKALSEASHKLAEAMYQNQTAGANAQDKKKDDDVIDAEVE